MTNFPPCFDSSFPFFLLLAVAPDHSTSGAAGLCAALASVRKRLPSWMTASYRERAAPPCEVGKGNSSSEKTQPPARAYGLARGKQADGSPHLTYSQHDFQ